MYNVTLRRVRESFLPRKSNKCYQFFCVCVRAAALASGRVHVRAPYCDVLAPLATPYFSSLSHIRDYFRGKNLLNIKCVLIFSKDCV
jgi:hypothetical protein